MAWKIFCQVKKAACRGVHLVCYHVIMGKKSTKRICVLHHIEHTGNNSYLQGKLSWLEKEEANFSLFSSVETFVSFECTYSHILENGELMTR